MLFRLDDGALRSRGVTVSGDRLRRLRLKAGLTQRELAEKSGYSERLIRKAERGGVLGYRTVRDLAEALFELNAIDSPSELCASDDRHLAEQFIELALDCRRGHRDSRLLHSILDLSVQLDCCGESTTSALFGSFVGIPNVIRWIDLLRSYMDEQYPALAPSIICENGFVSIEVLFGLMQQSLSSGNILWEFRLEIVEAKIRRVSVLLDTARVERFFRDVSERQFRLGVSQSSSEW